MSCSHAISLRSKESISMKAKRASGRDRKNNKYLFISVKFTSLYAFSPPNVVLPARKSLRRFIVFRPENCTKAAGDRRAKSPWISASFMEIECGNVSLREASTLLNSIHPFQFDFGFAVILVVVWQPLEIGNKNGFTGGLRSIASPCSRLATGL